MDAVACASIPQGQIHAERTFAGFCRTFIVLWVIYLATTPFRPIVNSPVPEDIALDEATVQSITAQLDDEFFAVGNGLHESPGIRSWLNSSFGSWLVGCDKAAHQKIIQNRRAWFAVLFNAKDEPEAKRNELFAAAEKARWSHPILGRGGLPVACDELLFYPRYPIGYNSKPTRSKQVLYYWIQGHTK